MSDDPYAVELLVAEPVAVTDGRLRATRWIRDLRQITVVT
jgi:hypothetical protein